MELQAQADDHQAMHRLRKGEDLALNEIMGRWSKPLLSFIIRVIGNREDALDLAQQTFVKLYDSRARYKPQTKFSTFLFTIALNLCRNHRRWQSRHPTLSASQLPKTETLDLDLQSSSAPSPDEIALQREQSKTVQEAIHNLPEDLREPLLLSEYQGLSHSEISDILGCSPKAVETRLYRARKILNERLSIYLNE